MLTTKKLLSLLLAGMLVIGFAGCADKNNDNNNSAPMPRNPDTAPQASVDRFSDDAGTLFQRSSNPSLPAANAAINMDDSSMPFKTRGLGPQGNVVEYYNFDIMSATPAPIYVLKREGESTPVDGQLNIVDVKPGDSGYNDFWRVNFVTVPANYVANTVYSYQQIMDNGYMITPADVIVNCPIVPDNSTASLRVGGGETGLSRGWYRGDIIHYFNFAEHAIMPDMGMVPISDIYVCFNINPGMPGGGPPSGFHMEQGMMQTHNVVATVPADPDYSPMWNVNAYDNADFANVHNLMEAQNANIVGVNLALVNCPIVVAP